MNAEAVVDAAVASDVVPEEDTELAALVEYFTAADLTLDYSTASYIPLSAIFVNSAAASIHLSRSAASSSIRRSRSVCHSSSSSLAAAAAAAFSSYVKASANLKQSVM